MTLLSVQGEGRDFPHLRAALLWDPGRTRGRQEDGHDL